MIETFEILTKGKNVQYLSIRLTFWILLSIVQVFHNSTNNTKCEAIHLSKYFRPFQRGAVSLSLSRGFKFMSS